MNSHQVLGSFSNTNLNIFWWLNWICKVDRQSRHNRNIDDSDRYSTILHITVAVGQNYWMVLFGPDKIWDTKVCCTQWIYKTSFDFCTYLLTCLECTGLLQNGWNSQLQSVICFCCQFSWEKHMAAEMFRQ